MWVSSLVIAAVDTDIDDLLDARVVLEVCLDLVLVAAAGVVTANGDGEGFVGHDFCFLVLKKRGSQLAGIVADGSWTVSRVYVEGNGVSLLGLLLGTVGLDGIRVCGDGRCMRGFVRGVVSDGLCLAGLVDVYLLVKVLGFGGKRRRDLDALVGGSRGGHFEFGRRSDCI